MPPTKTRRVKPRAQRTHLQTNINQGRAVSNHCSWVGVGCRLFEECNANAVCISFSSGPHFQKFMLMEHLGQICRMPFGLAISAGQEHDNRWGSMRLGSNSKIHRTIVSLVLKHSQTITLEESDDQRS